MEFLLKKIFICNFIKVNLLRLSYCQTSCSKIVLNIFFVLKKFNLVQYIK